MQKRSSKKKDSFSISAIIDDAAQRIAYFETHIFEFGLYYFPFFFPLKSASFHKNEIAEKLKFKNHLYYLLIGGRGTAKTTWAKIKILHSIVYRKKRFIPIICNDKNVAKAHLFDVAVQLQTNRLLIRDFGQLFFDENIEKEKKSKKKSIEQLITENGVQLRPFSTKTPIRGLQYMAEDGVFRPDFVMIDDFENVKTARSSAETNNVIEFLKEMWAALTASCEVVFCCNRIKKNGSVSYLEALADADKFEKWTKSDVRMIRDGKITWPSRYVWTELEARILNKKKLDSKAFVESVEALKEKHGTSVFEREYNNTPFEVGDELIKEQWLTPHMFVNNPPLSGGKIVITIDPKAGEKTTSDEFAITVLFVPIKSPHRYVLDQIAGRVSQLHQAALFVATCQKWKSQLAVAAIETVLNQTAVYQNVKSWQNREIDLKTASEEMAPEFQKVLETLDDNDRNLSFIKTAPTKDKVARLQMQEASFQRGEIHIKPEMQTLKEQLMYLHIFVKEKGKHDDRADSLISALELANKINWTQYSYEDSKDSASNLAGNLYKNKF